LTAPSPHFAAAGTRFHAVLLDAVLRIDAGEVVGAHLAGQMAGERCEEMGRHFLESGKVLVYYTHEP